MKREQTRCSTECVAFRLGAKDYLCSVQNSCNDRNYHHPLRPVTDFPMIHNHSNPTRSAAGWSLSYLTHIIPHKMLHIQSHCQPMAANVHWLDAQLAAGKITSRNNTTNVCGIASYTLIEKEEHIF